MKVNLQRKELAKNALWAALLALGIVIYYYRMHGFLMIGDALFLSGLLFCALGVFRITRRLELYHSTIYGFKRLFRGLRSERDSEKIGSYSDFLEENPYEKPFAELLIIGIVLIAVSIFCK